MNTVLLSPVTELRESLGVDMSTMAAMIGLEKASLEALEQGKAYFHPHTLEFMQQEGIISDSEVFGQQVKQYAEDVQALHQYAEDNNIKVADMDEGQIIKVLQAG